MFDGGEYSNVDDISLPGERCAYRKNMLLNTMQKLSRLRSSILQHYKEESAKMLGLTPGLLIETRVMWIEIPFLLIRPERLFFLHLKSSTRYPPTQTLFGPISFPEYVPHPSLEQLCKNTMCLIDYFCDKQLPEPDALLYIKKKEHISQTLVGSHYTRTTMR